MNRYLAHAVANSRMGANGRKFLLAAVGLRKDGALVVSTNGGTPGERTPSAHAEARLARKLDVGAKVFVARTLKNGTVANARPCENCQRLLRNKGVRIVHYTIGPNEEGKMEL